MSNESDRRSSGAANEAARRASGAANEAARRASGAANEAARRASGAANEAARRGDSQQVQRDLNRLVRPPIRRQELRTVAARGAAPAARGRSDYVPPAAGRGGIASPLTEPSFAAREWWDDGWKTSDGLFTIPMPKKIIMRDANNAEVVFEYAKPGTGATP